MWRYILFCLFHELHLNKVHLLCLFASLFPIIIIPVLLLFIFILYWVVLPILRNCLAIVFFLCYAASSTNAHFVTLTCSRFWKPTCIWIVFLRVSLIMSSMIILKSVGFCTPCLYLIPSFTIDFHNIIPYYVAIYTPNSSSSLHTSNKFSFSTSVKSGSVFCFFKISSTFYLILYQQTYSFLRKKKGFNYRHWIRRIYGGWSCSASNLYP